MNIITQKLVEFVKHPQPLNNPLPCSAEGDSFSRLIDNKWANDHGMNVLLDVLIVFIINKATLFRLDINLVLVIFMLLKISNALIII